MAEFRDNVDKHEAVNVPEDPDSPPEEWAWQQVGSSVTLLLQWQQIHAADMLKLVCCALYWTCGAESNVGGCGSRCAVIRTA
jgi:hypothetical protein